MADKRPLLPRLLIAVAVLVALLFAIRTADVWYAERQAASDLAQPPQAGTPPTENAP